MLIKGLGDRIKKGLSNPKFKPFPNTNQFTKSRNKKKSSWTTQILNRLKNFKQVKYKRFTRFFTLIQNWLLNKLFELLDNFVIYGMQSGYAIDGTVPVFAFPPEVNFYLGDVNTHKQLITFYNPYNTSIKFKVLCTAPEKYQVGHAQGHLKSCCQTDIVVRHIDLRVGNCNVTDKIRIQVYNEKTDKVIGKKDIRVTLHNGIPEPTKDNDNDSITSSDRTHNDWESSSTSQIDPIPRDAHYRTGSSNPIVIFIGFVSFVALFLPIEGDESVIPFKITFNLKLVFSYILGLVTMVIFRS